MAPGGRSSGCKTCRMRHLKCDEARPTCLRCQRADLECRGYEVIDVFVDERSKIIERGSKPKPARRKRTAARTENHESTIVFRAAPVDSTALVPFGSSASSSSSSSSDETTDITVSRHAPIISPLLTLLPLIEDDLFLTYMIRKIASGMPDRPIVDGHGRGALSPHHRRGGWLLKAFVSSRDQPPLKSAAAAVSRAWFAKTENQPSVYEQGTGYYCKALNEMKDAISDNRWQGRGVLIAALCMIIYETVVKEAGMAWSDHAMGLAHLINAQGPQAFQDEAGLMLLRLTRYPMIMACITNRQHIFLAKPEWSTVPWQRFPEMKEDLDYLFDVFATVPGLVTDVSEWEKHKSTDPQEIIEGIKSSVSELCDWRWNFEITKPGYVWVDESRSADPPELFSYSLGYESFRTAHVLAVHDSVLTMLLLLAQRLRGPELDLDSLLPEPPAELVKVNPMILPGVDPLDITDIGRQICQSIKARIELREHNAAAFGLFLPTRVAWLVLKDLPAESEWLREIVSNLEKRSAVQVQRLMFWTTETNPFIISDLQ